uniref:Uncharacterized protein n=1 Tax=Leersia perrieri TaxID=77586 RepID=A0A0D9WW48_9ORYZ
MCKHNHHHHDVEAQAAGVGGGGVACMYMIERPELRWAFIRKLVVTVAVAAVFYLVPAIRRFFLARRLRPLMLPTMFLRKRHPINLILLALFTVCIAAPLVWAAFPSKWHCNNRSGVPNIRGGLRLDDHTFWAAKRGHDFSFLRPFLVMLLPMGKFTTTVYGCLAALVFSGFIIYDTDNLIKRHTYDEYVAAAISLYLDTVNIFMAIVTALNASDS